MEEFNIKLTYIEPMLGTVPKDKEIYKNFIAKKIPKGIDDEEEIQTVEDLEIANWTGFHLVNDAPILYDYLIKGHFKTACGALRRISGTLSNKLTSYKKCINELLFVFPRQIPINLNGNKIENIERPLRGQTQKGEIVTLVRSDFCPVGSQIEFKIKIFGVISDKLLKEWLDYGEYFGHGQWRNAGYGRFKYEFIK